MPKMGRMALRVVPFVILPFIMNFPAVSYGFSSGYLMNKIT